MNVFGFLNDGENTMIDIKLNSNEVEQLSIGNVAITIRDDDAKYIGGATTQNTNITNGNRHYLVVTTKTDINTITVYVDGISYNIYYGFQQTPTNFKNAEYAIPLGARNNRGTIERFFS
jgi:hypothetical protein